MALEQHFDIIIIGGGVIGALIAREVSKYNAKVLVLEKNNDVCSETSAANSAIVHSGYDPVPGTLKAHFNVASIPLFPKLCQELDVEFHQIGSLTVAMSEADLPRLKHLEEQAALNNVPVQILNRDDVLIFEPKINKAVSGALFAPTAGVVNPFELTIHAMENAIDNGVELLLNELVEGISKVDDGWKVVSASGKAFITKAIVNAAGVHADKIARLVGDDSFFIKPRKGSYYVLDHFDNNFVNHVIFPMPSEKGKGILLTPTTSRNYLVGPSSEFSGDTLDVATDTLTMENIKQNAINLLPDIPFHQVIRVFSGLRATPNTGDFIIKEASNARGFYNVAGIESPGLAAGPAIAKHVVEQLLTPYLGLIAKEDFNPFVKPYIHVARLDHESRHKLTEINKQYADIVCNCEQVSLGEILDTLTRSCPPHSLKAVKNRTRAGFGKCQGGVCQLRLIKILADYYGISPTDVVYGNEDSHFLREESKK